MSTCHFFDYVPLPNALVAEVFMKSALYLCRMRNFVSYVCREGLAQSGKYQVRETTWSNHNSERYSVTHMLM